MIKNHLTIAARMLRKNRLYSVINVLGLATGIACCLLIAFWAKDELSYDRFHANADRIYRVNKVYTPTTGGTELHALTPGPMAPTLTKDFPEVEEAVRVLPWFSDILLINGEMIIPTADVVFADSNFFDVFSFRMLAGDPGTALVAPLSIVLSESLARSLYGTADVLGRTLTGMGDLTFTVTGVVEDPPEHSHLKYSSFISWSSVISSNDLLNFNWLERWLPQSLFTYVLLQPGASSTALDAKLPAFIDTYLPSRSSQYRFYLQPLADIYLGSQTVQFQRSMVNGSGTSVRILVIVGILILLIACVNFMNLATAQSGRRALEVGVRKSMGAGRGQLVVQFLGEAMMLVGLAFVLALAFVEVARPFFNSLTGKHAESLMWLTPVTALALVVLALSIGVVSGIYPALVLTRFNPIRALKGGRVNGGGHLLQKAMVITQFVASTILLVGTVIVFQQMKFVQNTDPGFDRDQIVVLNIGPTDISDQLGAFREELLRDPRILSATATNQVPGESFSSYSIVPEGRTDDEGLISDALFLQDTDLLQTYGMSLASGRFFDADRPADSSGVVINQAMARSLGWTDAVGKRFEVSDDFSGTVIGVVKDFQLASLHQEIVPLFMQLSDRSGRISLRVGSEDVAGALAHVRSTWEKFESRYPFEYSFLDDDFARLYDLDRRLMKTLSAFAVIAVLVACLGLFGLATYAAERRMKEVGVRKVLGASVLSVVALLSRDFARLILIAFLIAAPVAWLIMQRWLDGFAYRITIGPGVLAVSGGLLFAIAIATVATQAWRAAKSDPVKTLRYE